MIILAILGYVGFYFKSIYSVIQNFVINRFSFSISSISQYYETYFIINEFITNIDSKLIKNNITLFREQSEDGDFRMVKRLNYGEYVFWHKGSLFIINKNKNETLERVTETIYIRIVFNFKKYQETIVNLVSKRKMTPEYTRIYLTRWEFISKHNKSFDSIFNKEKEIIINHLDTFKKNKEIYKKHGLNYKTGILLYGEPGTGKTSIARAIAQYMDYDIYIINLNQYRSHELVERIASIPKKSVILIEEIDCSNLDKRNKNETVDTIKTNNTQEKPNTDNGKEILSALLNCLDGYASPEECIFVATTNYKDKLDSALIRTGRMDLHVELKKIDKNDIIRMCHNFDIFDQNFIDSLPDLINPSVLQNILLSNGNRGVARLCKDTK